MVIYCLSLSYSSYLLFVCLFFLINNRKNTPSTYPFLFDCGSRLFASQVGHLIVQRGNNVREPFDPRSRPLARRQEHFHAIQMDKQTFVERACETLHNSLGSVNFSSECIFCGFPFLGQTLHKLTARVNLQNLRRSQRAALVNRLESLRNFGRGFRGQRLGFYVTAADVDNGHRVFANFSAAWQLLVWQKKKVRLMERVRC